MAALTTQKPSAAGVAVTYAACNAGGDTFVNTGREFIHVKNASGGALTVTISSGSNKCSFGIANAAHDLAVSVGAGSDKMIGPFDKDRFNDTSGNVNLSYSGVTSLSIAVLSGL